eukprot:m51a1_g14605 hypothetical protein (135) ;mRNA; f:1194836-1195485
MEEPENKDRFLEGTDVIRYTSEIATPNKRFVSEKELDERRARLAQSGTKEREYDPDARPLWEKLQENKMKEEEAFRAKFAMPTPKSLDEDESKFLEELEQQKTDREKEISHAEDLELELFKARIPEFQDIPTPV